MIRIVTARRLRRLHETTGQARTRAREIQQQADDALGRHVRQVRELTARAGKAEAAALAARWDKDLAEAEAGRLREELEAARLEKRTLVLLLRYGEPHSIHLSREDAYAYAATQGAPVHGWQPSGERPGSQAAWWAIPFTQDEAVMGLRPVTVPSPKPVGGAS